MQSCCIEQGTICNHLGRNMMEDNVRKGMCIYTYNRVTLLYRILQHFKSTIMKIKKKKNLPEFILWPFNNFYPLKGPRTQVGNRTQDYSVLVYPYSSYLCISFLPHQKSCFSMTSHYYHSPVSHYTVLK